jgi:hypothetical protein
MKIFLFSIIVVISGVAFANEHADGGPLPPPGNEGPYGGGGMICGHENLKGMLWDLWESEAFKKMPTTHTNELTTKQQVQKALDTYLRLNGMLPQEIVDTAWDLYDQVENKRLNSVPAGLEITPPTDLQAPFRPVDGTDCHLRGIGAYDDTSQTLFVDYNYYDILNFNTDRAALFIHEAVYKYFRDHYGVKNSIAARNIVSCLFGDTPCEELDPTVGVPNDGPLYRCSPKGWSETVILLPTFNMEDFRMAQPEFYLFPNPKSQTPMKTMAGFQPWRFQLTSMKKRMALSLSGFEWENVPARSFFDVQIDSDGELDLRKDGTLMSSVLSPKASLDMVLPTYSSDSSDPWRKALGPRFSFHLYPTAVVNPPDVPTMEMNGFPLNCQKIR